MAATSNTCVLLPFLFRGLAREDQILPGRGDDRTLAGWILLVLASTR